MSEKTHKQDVTFIRALAELLNEHDLTQISVKRLYGENDSLNVRVSRGQEVVYQAPHATAPAAAPSAPAAGRADPPIADAAEEGDPASLTGAVNSPMVGTAYLQGEPGAPAFVKIGDTVEEGDTLLIVEAMKTMNHIPAPHGGKVARILVGNGDAVEYGTPLMIIE